jgi:hypothetical protein
MWSTGTRLPSSGLLGHIGATTGPRTNGLQRTTTVTAGHHLPSELGTLPHPPQVAATRPGSLTRKKPHVSLARLGHCARPPAAAVLGPAGRQPLGLVGGPKRRHTAATGPRRHPRRPRVPPRQPCSSPSPPSGPVREARVAAQHPPAGPSHDNEQIVSAQPQPIGHSPSSRLSHVSSKWASSAASSPRYRSLASGWPVRSAAISARTAGSASALRIAVAMSSCGTRPPDRVLRSAGRPAGRSRSLLPPVFSVAPFGRE